LQRACLHIGADLGGWFEALEFTVIGVREPDGPVRPLHDVIWRIEREPAPGIDDGLKSSCLEIYATNASPLIKPALFADQETAPSIKRHSVRHVRRFPYDFEFSRPEWETLAVQGKTHDGDVFGAWFWRGGEVERVLARHVYRPLMRIRLDQDEAFEALAEDFPKTV
jgi:hypothetical protein